MQINKKAEWCRVDIDDKATYPKPQKALLFMRKRPDDIDAGALWWDRFYGTFDGKCARPDRYPGMRFSLTEIEAWMPDRILDAEDEKNLERIRYESIK